MFARFKSRSVGHFNSVDSTKVESCLKIGSTELNKHIHIVQYELYNDGASATKHRLARIVSSFCIDKQIQAVANEMPSKQKFDIYFNLKGTCTHVLILVLDDC